MQPPVAPTHAPTLESIPPEILSSIAYYLAISPATPAPAPRATHHNAAALGTALSSSSPTLPTHAPSVHPAPLVPLLGTSRTIHSTLAFSANASLYARVFEEKFDVAAARRRLGYEETSDGALAEELRTRCIAMRHMNEAVAQGDIARIDEQDIYTVYLMLLENDGKNLKYLLSPAANTPLLAFLFLYHDRDLVQKATSPGLPPHTVMRTLVLWIIWLLTSPQGMEKEEMEDIEEFLFCLRPYVFAARQFEVTFAPWTLMDLPLQADPSAPAPTPTPDPTTAYNPYIADPTPRSRLIHINHYGRPRPLCAPVLAHAAILNFFARVDRLLGTSRFELADNAADLTGGMDGPAPVARGVTEGEAVGHEGQSIGNQQVVIFRPRRSSRYVAYTPAKRSEIHDADYKRLTRCYDPHVSPGMAIEDWVGRFTGCWEGSFSFFDYDAYKSMLSGESRALYEGQFGEQTQVWRLQEVCVRPLPSTTGPATRSASASPLNAGFDLHSSTFDQLIPLLASKAATGALPAFNASSTGSVTSAVVKMLENGVREDYLVAMLGGLEGMQVVPETELNTILKRRRGELDDDDDEDDEMSVNARGKQPSGAGLGDDLELMLVGTGHSAWGEFLLRGRVRLWDGMVTLVKEYSPDGRGRWLYRGYVVGNNVFVGRWRDCVTPQDFIGYEGTFTLAQRIDETIAEASDETM